METKNKPEGNVWEISLNADTGAISLLTPETFSYLNMLKFLRCLIAAVGAIDLKLREIEKQLLEETGSFPINLVGDQGKGHKDN
ncbi:MAG: hypothetical protein NC828_03085 [Candidatus Omnitrophica bacterium]|nr:hypothetical protein [Candidatus Omnitrophota bacterium]